MDAHADTQISILLIEHQTLVRIGIKTILEADKDFKIVGETETGAEGLTAFQKMQPDVTVLSLHLPDSCAIDTLGDYFAVNKNAKIIVLADTAGDAEIAKALKKGARGFICKDIAANELIKALRAVAAGKKYIPNDIAEILSENFGNEELTRTESKILRQIVAGQSNKQIAYDFEISENTVKTHVKNIFEKLGVTDRTSAATAAIKRGLVRFDI